MLLKRMLLIMLPIITLHGISVNANELLEENKIIETNGATFRDTVLSQIEKEFIVGKFYKSNWNDTLICSFKNNSEYDIYLGITATFFDENGDWSSISWNDLNYFESGSEAVVVFDAGNFKDYQLEYSVKKSEDKVKKLYKNAGFSTLEKEDGTVSYSCTNNVPGGFCWDAVIVYYDDDGNVIDYDKAGGGVAEYYGFDETFELPVDENLDTVSYATYKASCVIMQFD